MSTSHAPTQPAHLSGDAQPLRFHNDSVATQRIHFIVDTPIAFDLSLRIEVVRDRDGHTVYRGAANTGS